MHRFANPARFLSIAKPLTPMLFWPGLLLVLGACWWGLTQVPAERLQGDSVKIMFVHVPAAWLGMAGLYGGTRWRACRPEQLQCLGPCLRHFALSPEVFGANPHGVHGGYGMAD
jgi:ABC-type transport system involved in cytochrome c biogenesis permease subunit